MFTRKVKSTLVISGYALRFLENRDLKAGGVAVVLPKLLHFHEGFVRGVALDNQRQRFNFSMPIEEFEMLWYSEASEVSDAVAIESSV